MYPCRYLCGVMGIRDGGAKMNGYVDWGGRSGPGSLVSINL